MFKRISLYKKCLSYVTQFEKSVIDVGQEGQAITRANILWKKINILF